VVASFIFKYWVVDWPETAKFLNDDERRMLLRRLAEDSADARMDHLDKRAAKRVFTDWKIYCGIMMYMGVVNTGYATSFFIPTIIQELGFTAEASQIRSIPIFLVAAVLSLSTAYAADYFKHRYAFTMAGVAVGTTGYVILLCQDQVPSGVKYMACFFITAGGYMTQPVTWVWLSNVRPSLASVPYSWFSSNTLYIECRGSLQAKCRDSDANRHRKLRWYCRQQHLHHSTSSTVSCRLRCQSWDAADVRSRLYRLLLWPQGRE
jgi:hypothetical protein